ncbi:tripartite tricarboxylate transporter substrate binding protein [Pusillimonas sp. TS35]|uniref:Bug family tripartite tricarboxylate transporter substrate binding protein n=1 Tax=Paracandidimonas lactea TaxID=2895524 RepID=UPI00136C6041|nr:tripartite tricarboxylate transporter substrate binding protein [Paracandidimonas lactea]MYN13473.1 tripartite tricarboxylate transporter substrate binding protein [Pusillimonas sp. TS35]
MKPYSSYLYALVAAVGIVGLPAGQAQAAYPERPVAIVVNYPPGGPLDIVARLVAEDASQQLGQTVIVENHAGAGGQVGGQYVARQKPDGYTLLLTVDTLYTVNPFVYTKSKFDARKVLVPISMAGVFNQTLVAHPSLGVKTLAQFVDKAKASDLTYASAGLGSPGHLTMAYFNQQLDGKLTHVPYQGNAPATNGLLAGQTDVGFLITGGSFQFVKAGKLVPLAVSGGKRDPKMPDVPTIAESGIKGLENFDVSFGYALMAPEGTSEAVVQTWSDAMKKAFANPRIRERLDTLGLEPVVTTPAQTRVQLDKAAARWEQVVKKADISIH